MRERRQNLRLDKLFPVYLLTADGLTRGIGRNISTRGMFVEIRDTVPLGEQLRVTLVGEDGTEMTFVCEVRYQVALSYGRGDGSRGQSRGVGLRIIGCQPREEYGHSLSERERVMH